MIELKNHSELRYNEENHEFSFDISLVKDSKDISGRQNIIAQVKSDEAEILTSEVKLSKNTEIKFTNPTSKDVNIHLQIEDESQLITVQFQLNSEEQESSENIEVDSTIESEETIEFTKTTESTEDKSDNVKLDANEYPILNSTSQIEFDFVFTSQIKEILSGEIKSENTKRIYDKALSTTNKILFFRDTNTSIYYWITKDVILNDTNFTNLMIEVNEYNRSKK